MKLHIGSGATPLPGWTNVDLVQYPGVDKAFDVRKGLPYEGVRLIFAEHFIEHLTLAEGLAFLKECRRVLDATGVLRLSTPNLDWVWLTHYKRPAESTPEEQLIGCLEMNRAFHGWGHRFLYNFRMLSLAVRAAGFEEVHPRAYGKSSFPDLRDIERHERHADVPGAPSVIVVEATGLGTAADTSFATRVERYINDAAAS